MEKLLKNMGFSQSEVEKLCPEIQKFISAENEMQQLKKEIRTIKISLILLVAMVAVSIVS